MEMNNIYGFLKEQLEEQLLNRDPKEHERITVKMLKFPSEHSWPAFPVLPLIRKADESASLSLDNIDQGFAMAWNTKCIYLGNMHFKPEKVVEYADIEEAVADGWLVDF